MLISPPHSRLAQSRHLGTRNRIEFSTLILSRSQVIMELKNALAKRPELSGHYTDWLLIRITRGPFLRSGTFLITAPSL